MNVDIVEMDDGHNNCCVFNTPNDECAEYYKDIPLFSGSLADCIEWCDDKRNLVDSWRVRKYAHLVRHRFIKDVEARADKCLRSILDCGIEVVSDVIYKASAAWKEQPIHYAYCGDLGGSARITWRDNIPESEIFEARASLNYLFGMADSMWELGFNLTFDKNGKHTVFGNFPEWVTVDEKF